jgi:hypothetical protein
MTTPYIGMIVEYRYQPHDEPLPAIVNKLHYQGTSIDDTWVGLCILGPGETRYVTHVERGVRWREIAGPPKDQPGSSPAPQAADAGNSLLWGGVIP